MKSQQHRIADIPPENRDFHHSLVVIDIHTHFLINAYFLGKRFDKRHTPPFFYNPLANYLDLPRCQEGGISGLAFTVYEPGNPIFRNRNFQRSLAIIDRFFQLVSKNPDQILFTNDSSGFAKAKQENKIAAFLTVEGGHVLQGRLENLEALYEKGVRLLTLTHFISNEIADSCTSPFKPLNGLSPFGVEVVQRMNELGMIIDVAHCSEKAFYQVLKHSSQPVVSSHGALRHFVKARRNISDEMVKAIAAAGGLIGIIFFPLFTDSWGLFTSIDRIIDHMVRVAELTSPEHLVIGSDMDGYTWLPRGLTDVTSLPIITHLLLKRGFSKEDVRNIMGLNFVRLFKKICDKKAG